MPPARPAPPAPSRARLTALAATWGAAVLVRAIPLLAACGLLVLAVAVGLRLGHAIALPLILTGPFIGLGFRLAFTGTGVTPPPLGVLLRRGAEPALDALVDEVAAAAGRRRPARIRVTLDLAVRVRREQDGPALCVGLPWLTATTPDELRGAILHAFARQAAGEDSRADAPTERVVLRVLEIGETLAWLAGPLSLVLAPYARLAAWADGAAHRRRVAAGDAALDPDALAAHRRAVTRTDAFAEFWQQDVSPCLDAGFLPPVLGGWRLFLADDIAARATPFVLAADESALDRQIVAAVLPNTVGDLVELSWSRVADAVWLPLWRELLAELGDELPSFAPATLELAVAATPPAGYEAVWPDPLAAALAIALVDEQGWTATKLPGVPVEVALDGHVIRPFGLCASLVGGDRPAPVADGDEAGEHDDRAPATWAEFADAAGIADVPVGPPGPGPGGLEGAPAHVSGAGLPFERTEAVGPAASAGAGSSVQSAERPPPPTAGATALPATVVRRLALAPAPARRRDLVLVALLGALGVPTGVVFVVLAPAMPRPLLSAAFGLVVLGLTVAYAVTKVRLLWPSGSVLIGGSGLSITHPGVLHEPFGIPRHAVRAVLVDPDWAQERSFALPLIGVGDERPNVAVLLHESVAPPRARRQRSAGVLDGVGVSGLLLAVEDPDAVRAAFAPWQVLSDPRAEDARRVPAVSPAALDAGARLSAVHRNEVRRGWGLVALGLLFPPIALAGAFTGLVVRRSGEGGQVLLIAAGLAVFAVRLALYV